MTRTCQREGCGTALPRNAATQRKYCTGRCQKAAARARHREGTTMSAHQAVERVMAAAAQQVWAEGKFASPEQATFALCVAAARHYLSQAGSHPEALALELLENLEASE